MSLATDNPNAHALHVSGVNREYFDDYERGVAFLKRQLDVACRVSNYATKEEHDALLGRQWADRAQNIRRVLVDLREMEASCL